MVSVLVVVVLLKGLGGLEILWVLGRGRIGLFLLLWEEVVLVVRTEVEVVLLVGVVLELELVLRELVELLLWLLLERGEVVVVGLVRMRRVWRGERVLLLARVLLLVKQLVWKSHGEKECWSERSE